MQEIITPVMALLGVIVGSLLNFLLTRFSSNSNFKRDVELKAYLAYIEAVSSMAMSIKNGKDKNEYRKSLVMLTNAKVEISLVGSSKTIDCLAAFENEGADLRNKRSQELFQEVVKAMRSSVRKDEKIKFDNLALLLFGAKTYNEN